MAIVDTIPTLAITRQPFETPPQVRTMWGMIPRGFVHFALDGVTLDAKPINDDQHLRISGVLPAGFAYQFVQVDMTLAQDVAASWTPLVLMRCVNWIPNAAAGIHLVFSLQSTFEFADAAAVTPVEVMRGIAGSGEGAGYGFGRQIIFNPQGGAISFSFLAVNETDPAGAAGTIDFIASFLEFDLTQATRFGLQTSIPVNLR